MTAKKTQKTSTKKLQINPISFTDLNFDELEEFEEIVGMIPTSVSDKVPLAKTMKALVYLTLKRDNPDLTVEEVGTMSIDIVNDEDDLPKA